MTSTLFTLTTIFSGFIYADTISKVFDSQGIQLIRIDTMESNVNIQPTTDDKIHIEGKKINVSEKCKIEIKKTSSEVIVSTKAPSGFWSDLNCEIDFAVKIPSTLTVNLKSGSGNFEVAGLSGDIDFSIGSGNVKINGASTSLNGKTGSGNIFAAGRFNQLDIRTGSGDVKAVGLTSGADIRTGSGDISLTYKTVPEMGNVDIKSGSGNAIVYLPNGSKLTSEIRSGSGSIYNEFGDSKESAFRVSLKTGSGDLKIKKIQ